MEKFTEYIKNVKSLTIKIPQYFTVQLINFHSTKYQKVQRTNDTITQLNSGE